MRDALESKSLSHAANPSRTMGQPHTHDASVFTESRHTRPTKIVNFPRCKAEKSRSQQHAVSYNRPISQPRCHINRLHALEGADLTVDPFEHPINTVQVSRCVPFLGSPLSAIPVA